MAHKVTLAAWLSDAYAMENALIPILQNHADDVKDHPAMRERILEHVEETRRQADRVKDCLARLGETPSTTKSILGSLFGMMQAPATGMYSDERVKNAILDFASENFEIASYEAIIAAAEQMGEVEIVAICRENLQEERNMAEWLRDQLPRVVQEYTRHAMQAVTH